MAESSSKKKKKHAADAACSGKSARPHWRRRDPADTSVYVVHPTQFCTVVQQLTGAASSWPPAPQYQGGNVTAAAQVTQPAAGTGPNNAQQHGSTGEENSSSGKTLRQIHDECMAWANADD
ncbi:hypothetical protein BAE44_0007697 [Dichanthelium oligosanthes]|uniref:VQ domain-containing protein n=1 Tax=Dichanthelium oligosanthes TaxID=888268 RepID=A0A1E5W1L7_9POAL|nr:hypothetical protein BAE44_0007697 [Dichanthelium oligosanthes]